MIEIRDRQGAGVYYLAAELIESIFEREGNTCEIRTTTGRMYTSIESKEDIAKRINRVKMALLSEVMRNDAPGT